jgi:Tol biopolymer transport system component
VAVASERGGKSRLLRLVPWALLAASLAVIGWLWSAREGAEVAEARHLAIPSPDDAEFHITGSFPGLPEISPDGRRLAFSGVSQPDNAVDLYVRDLDAEHAVRLNDTRDAQYAFWSPDSRWLGFYSRGTGLIKIPVDGGPSQKIADATNGKGGSWNERGEILFTTDYNTSIFVVSADGGEVRPATDLGSDQGFNSHRHPQFMPDGRHFLYFARGNGRVESEIRYASLDGGPHKVVTRSNMMGHHGSGHLLYVVNGDLVAQAFDPDTGDLSGSPTPLVSSVMTIPGAAKGAFSVAANGRLVYLKGEAAEDASLSWRNRSGQETEQIVDLAPYDMVALSPDERSAAVGIITRQAGTWDLWIVDLARNFKTRFTLDPADDADMVWSGDSRGVYFVSDRAEFQGIFFKEIGSPDAPRQVFTLERNMRLWDVSDDGRTIIFSVGGEGTNWDLWSAELDGASEPRRLRHSADHDVCGQFSPDERWLTFASRESGVWQVYVAPWPELSPITQVSIDSGTWSRWTKDGRELVYLDTTGKLKAVSMTVEDGRMRVGSPEELFQIGAPVLEAVYWSVSADGERFMTVNTQAREAPAYCNLVLDWPAILDDR